MWRKAQQEGGKRQYTKPDVPRRVQDEFKSPPFGTPDYVLGNEKKKNDSDRKNEERARKKSSEKYHRCLQEQHRFSGENATPSKK